MNEKNEAARMATRASAAFALAASVVLAPAANAAPTEVDVQGTTLAIDPGPGYCQYQDLETYGWKPPPDAGDLVAIFVACEELDAYRQGKGATRFAMVIAKKVEEKARARAERERYLESLTKDPKGPMAKDAYAVYYAAWKPSADSKTAIVSGVTLVRGHTVHYALYRRNADESTTRELIYEAHPIMRYLVENNPPSTASPEAGPAR